MGGGIRMHISYHLHTSRLPPSPNQRFIGVGPPRCALTKQGHRFLTSVAVTSATHRLLAKFVSSSSKHVALTTLSHLLSPFTAHPHLSSLALPLYRVISEEASWFDWNAKLVAQVIAVSYKQQRFDEAQTLISETVTRLTSRERDLCNFYCHLIEFSAKHNSRRGFSDSCELLTQFVKTTSSVYVRRRAYESMIMGSCEMGLAREAENLMKEMKDLGLKPSMFDYRSIVYSYGRTGLLEHMKGSVVKMENEGYALDTVCCNMVLSSLGAHNELPVMALWLQKMKDLGIPFSIRTYNSVLNSCPTVMLMLQDPKRAPLSMEELMENLGGDEFKLVGELVAAAAPSTLQEAMEWTSSEVKLDLHGMHLSSAYLIFLQWLNEIRLRFVAGDDDELLLPVPAQITVVCGLGKHSSVRGESPVKNLMKEIILRMECPLRIDRKNVGCFVAKGNAFTAWLYATSN